MGGPGWIGPDHPPLSTACATRATRSPLRADFNLTTATLSTIWCGRVTTPSCCTRRATLARLSSRCGPSLSAWGCFFCFVFLYLFWLCHAPRSPRPFAFQPPRGRDTVLQLRLEERLYARLYPGEKGLCRRAAVPTAVCHAERRQGQQLVRAGGNAGLAARGWRRGAGGVCRAGGHAALAAHAALTTTAAAPLRDLSQWQPIISDRSFLSWLVKVRQTSSA